MPGLASLLVRFQEKGGSSRMAGPCRRGVSSPTCTQAAVPFPAFAYNHWYVRMKSDLATVDVIIVAVYVLGTTLIGAWFTRRQRDLRVYFVGNRDVSWLLVLVSIVATETSTV